MAVRFHPGRLLVLGRTHLAAGLQSGPEQIARLVAVLQQLIPHPAVDVQQVAGVGAGVLHHRRRQRAHPPVRELELLVRLNLGKKKVQHTYYNRTYIPCIRALSEPKVSHSA